MDGDERQIAMGDNQINTRLTFGYALLTAFIIYSLFAGITFWSGLFLGGGAAYVEWVLAVGSAEFRKRKSERGKTLRIIVQRDPSKDRPNELSTAEIVLIPPLCFHEGVELDYIKDAAGVEHYFTKAGYYDGYGGMTAGLDSR